MRKGDGSGRSPGTRRVYINMPNELAEWLNSEADRLTFCRDYPGSCSVSSLIVSAVEYYQLHVCEEATS